MNREHILIIDDEASHRRVMRTLLEPQGYFIFEAQTGNEALKLIASRRPTSFCWIW